MWTPPQRIRHPILETRWPTPTQASQSRWFSPLRFGPLHLHERTWVPAMVPWRATADGLVSDDVLDWYGRFAEGQPGAIVVEATGIRDIPSGPLLRIGDDRFIPGLKQLVEVVHRRSGGRTRVLIQLIDFLTVKRRPPADKFFSRFWQITDEHRSRLANHCGPEFLAADRDTLVAKMLATPELHAAVLSPRELRDLQVGYREEVNDLHLPHIRDLPTQLPTLFAQAAVRAKQAGFDGVELHYAHAYTMASFLSRTNTRTDGYGGDFRGRLRLPLEVYRAVRGSVGKELSVGCRLLGDEVIAGGNRIEDACALSVAFAEAGMDFVSVSKGGKFNDAKQPKVGQAVYPYTGPSGYECMPTVYSDQQGPFGRNAYLAAAIRQAVRSRGLETPVVAAGGINNFELAEQLLADGSADIVAAARQSLADPDWFKKVRLGRGAEVRRCKYTNYCEALDTKHKQVTCQLWDRVDLNETGVAKSDDGRRRLVAPPWKPEPT
ncbi:MAG: NADH:flavin oxidoreductase [Nannocystaceae bacterium]